MPSILCGPIEMNETLRNALISAGVLALCGCLGLSVIAILTLLLLW